MKKYRVIATLLTACLLALAGASHAQTVIDCGRVFNAVDGSLMGRHHITVTEGKISSINGATTRPNDAANSIDLSALTCLPGLIDMHVHLENQMSPRSYIEKFQLNAADLALRAAANANTTLNAGFTAVRNLGDSDNVTIALRKAVDAGLVPGPRIFSAGKTIATTGGHGDPTNGRRVELMGDPGPRKGVVNSPSDAAKAVRQRYKDGADVIKITATGGVLSTAKSGVNPQFRDEELAALIATANDYGFKVAAHAHGAEGMARAVKAGVASIEHGTLMDRKVMKLMVKNGTYLVPTVLAGEWVAQKAAIDGFFPDIVRPKAAAIGPQIQQTAGDAYRFGVKMAFGTDSGVSAHGDNAQEFTLLVEAGIPAAEALRMATVHAADLLGENDRLGILAEGAWADLVAVDGDPTQDISLMLDIPVVIKGGEVIKQP
ncbi:MAG: amidohydrolase family protein [Lysobacterales bacterium]